MASDRSVMATISVSNVSKPGSILARLKNTSPTSSVQTMINPLTRRSL